jgi:hypothetical protein
MVAGGARQQQELGGHQCAVDRAVGGVEQGTSTVGRARLARDLVAAVDELEVMAGRVEM